MSQSRPIPAAALTVANYVQQHNGNPYPNCQGGGKFHNYELLLPKVDPNGKAISYRKYDIKPPLPKGNRGRERIVIGTDGRRYYTNNHYKTFTEF